MNKFIIEFLGTLVFIFVVLSTNNPLAIGGTLAFVIAVSQKISYHNNFNPASTFAKTIAKKQPIEDFFFYIIIQMTAVLTALKLYSIK